MVHATDCSQEPRLARATEPSRDVGEHPEPTSPARLCAPIGGARAAPRGPDAPRVPGVVGTPSRRGLRRASPDTPAAAGATPPRPPRGAAPRRRRASPGCAASPRPLPADALLAPLDRANRAVERTVAVEHHLARLQGRLALEREPHDVVGELGVEPVCLDARLALPARLVRAALALRELAGGTRRRGSGGRSPCGRSDAGARVRAPTRRSCGGAEPGRLDRAREPAGVRNPRPCSTGHFSQRSDPTGRSGAWGHDPSDIGCESSDTSVRSAGPMVATTLDHENASPNTHQLSDNVDSRCTSRALVRTRGSDAQPTDFRHLFGNHSDRGAIGSSDVRKRSESGVVQAPARVWRPLSAVPTPVSLYYCHVSAPMSATRR